ncbi:hypothetical protein M9Y10_032424 [Tritrichomonas musculus]|uniref:DUF3447 domain-containing protein n=1 Tax=Tritrichomonas musculus TaxID=1915356 RepID=A0ABR2GYF7_9EUKA
MNQQVLDSIWKLEELWTNAIQYIDSHESSDTNEEINFQKFIVFCKDRQIEKDKSKMKIIFHIISDYYHENNDNNDSKIVKITKIVSLFKQFFSEKEIFHIFISKKRLLLYFYENNIISKQSFQEEIINLYDEIDFLQYFCIELRQLNSKEFEYRIEMNCFKDFIEENDKNIQLFMERRRKYQNISKISEIIRKDSIDEFTSFISQSNLNLNSKIENSIFESVTKEVSLEDLTLIEYAAFFGSQSIFKFLLLSDVKITTDLFLCAIHGGNYEIIHLIENCKIKVNHNDYIRYYDEAIKCHQNEIAFYIEENYLKENIEISSIEISIAFHNIQMLIHILKNHSNCITKKKDFNIFFYNLCGFGYTEIVDSILKSIDYDILHEKDEKINQIIYF